MILRNKRISNKSDEVQVYTSYSLTDVRTILKDCAKELATPLGDEWAKTQQLTENSITYYFEHSHKAFYIYPDKWREQLAKWAFSVALRNNLIKASATKENTYFLADSLFSKRGRPRKTDE